MTVALTPEETYRKAHDHYTQQRYTSARDLCRMVLDAVFLYYAARIYLDYSDRLAQATFRYSILYLMLLFSALLIDHYAPV